MNIHREHYPPLKKGDRGLLTLYQKQLVLTYNIEDKE
jgi:hypothetical protein